MSPPRVVFCDWHRTLCNQPFWSSVLGCPDHLAHRALADACGELFADREYVDAWMRGRVTSGEICAWVAARSGLCADWLENTLRADCRQMHPDLALLAALRATGAVLVLATDNMDCFADAADAHPALAGFERVLCSSRMGTLKATPQAFFGGCLRDLGRGFADALLVDDSEAGCVAFRSVGGHAIVHQDVRRTIAALRATFEPFVGVTA